MKKQIHILEGLMILIIILIAGLLSIKFIYHINHEKVDTAYMWNINFNNLQVTEGSKEGKINLSNNTLTLDVTLEKETEYYEFTLDIENKGTLNAQLKNINLAIDNPKNILTYQLNYLDGSTPKINDIINSNTIQTIIVRIEYPKQTNKIYEALNLSLSLSMEYTAVY